MLKLRRRPRPATEPAASIGGPLGDPLGDRPDLRIGRLLDDERLRAAMGLDKMADMYASVNLYGTPDEIVDQLRRQKEILAVDPLWSDWDLDRERLSVSVGYGITDKVELAVSLPYETYTADSKMTAVSPSRKSSPAGMSASFFTIA